jgi:hypothetical protein
MRLPGHLDLWIVCLDLHILRVICGFIATWLHQEGVLENAAHSPKPPYFTATAAPRRWMSQYLKVTVCLLQLHYKFL